ncbi:MAG: FMN-binding negative transcriptional regulator [Chloroflexota bacterium]
MRAEQDYGAFSYHEHFWRVHVHSTRTLLSTTKNAIHGLIEASNFAMVVTVLDGAPVASHVPLLFDAGEPHGVLRGHLARANSQWQAFNGEQEALVAFLGPHAYISPAWYETAPAVPTWNYVAVHTYGKPVVRNEEPWLSQLLHDLVAEHDHKWRMQDVPSAYVEKLKTGIVGFEMVIDRLEAKLKLNQHRPAGDRLGPAKVLECQDDTGARQLGALMRSIKPAASDK